MKFDKILVSLLTLIVFKGSCQDLEEFSVFELNTILNLHDLYNYDSKLYKEASNRIINNPKATLYSYNYSKLAEIYFAEGNIDSSRIILLKALSKHKPEDIESKILNNNKFRNFFNSVSNSDSGKDSSIKFLKEANLIYSSEKFLTFNSIFKFDQFIRENEIWENDSLSLFLDSINQENFFKCISMYGFPEKESMSLEFHAILLHIASGSDYFYNKLHSILESEFQNDNPSSGMMIAFVEDRYLSTHNLPLRYYLGDLSNIYSDNEIKFEDVNKIDEQRGKIGLPPLYVSQKIIQRIKLPENYKYKITRKWEKYILK
jgi:hypothetical protein